MIEQTTVEQGQLASRPGSRPGVAAFLGVPYAAPPVGVRRWRPPEPAEPWSGVLSADSYSPMAPQLPISPVSVYAHPETAQSEDCLYLNVWTAAGDSSERRPVMVWFHWGAFMVGSASWRPRAEGDCLFDGSKLAERGAVIVTVNYRLGRLGFLAHPWLSAEGTTGASGNYGFMDQVAALRWVQTNIESFGGDKNNVTIFGVSAGSLSVNLHMTSPSSAGLFHRAIAGSGAASAPMSLGSRMGDGMIDLRTAERRGEEFATAAGAQSLEDLRRLPIDILLRLPIAPQPGPWQPSLWEPGSADIRLGDGISDTYAPIVDHVTITDTPLDIFTAGQQNDVPLLTGSNLKDSSGLFRVTTLDAFQNYVHAEYGALAGRCLAAYPAANDEQVAVASGDLLGDRIFGWQNWTWARLARRYGSQPVYYYEWTHPAPVVSERYIERPAGAIHGMDIAYIFGTFSAFDWSWTDADHLLGDMIQRYWLNFAKSGNPNGEGLSEWRPLSSEWNSLAGDAGPVLAIAQTPRLGALPRSERFAFLDAVWSMEKNPEEAVAY